MKTLFCPRCGSKMIYSSRKRTRFERILCFLFFRQYARCRSCLHRFRTSKRRRLQMREPSPQPTAR